MSEGPFPKNIALLLTLTPPPVKYAAFTLPRELANKHARRFFFYLPGLKFDLVAGSNIHDVKDVCFHSSERKIVFVEEMSKEVKMVFAEGSRHARKTVKLHEYMTIVNARRR